jgi:TatD DNase family protein
VVIDSHCHLADEKFADDLPAVAARAEAAGVTEALCIIAADEAVEVARADVVRAAWPAVRFATAIHPHSAGQFAGRREDAARVVRDAVDRTSAVVIGEIGLDYHYDFSPRDVQREVFETQVEVALGLNRPVAIHTREASDDTFAVLRDAGRGAVRGVMHCFSHGEAELRQALDLGFFISIAGIVTFPKSGALRDVAGLVPLDRLLVETDAPFLAPVPHRGKRNEPAWVVETLRHLAALRGTTAESLGAQVSANFHTLVGTKDALAR